MTYWFERARAYFSDGKVNRAGLLATQGIRGGANRKVLERIKKSGDIFFAWSDRNWFLDGAAVHVSMIGFDGGKEQERLLDGRRVSAINADLTSTLDLTAARRLSENLGIAFQGPVVVGPFDIPPELAHQLLQQANPSGRSNRDVMFRVSNAADITGKSRGWYIIDFGQRSLEEAALYVGPFAYVSTHVKPLRDKNRDRQRREYWWRHGRAGTELRGALIGKSRQIATPEVSKHRIFAWLPTDTIVTQTIKTFARDDDYFFGVLHSKAHELWSRRTGTQLREVESGFRYTPSSTFETFPFTWPPGKEDQSDPKVQAIAEAARELVRLRDEWLGGGDPHPPPPSPAAAGEGEERGHADPLPSPIAEGEERGHADLLSSPIAMGEGPGVRAGGEPRALPDQISGLPDQGAGLSDQGGTLPDQGSGLSDKPSALPDKPSALPDKPEALPDQISGLSDQGGTLPDQGSGLSDKPEALPDKPGGLSDQADAGRGLAGAQPGDQQAPSPKPQAPGLKDRTLTNLYNKRPDWLVEAHRRLDAAVFDAYGWPSDPSAGSGQALSDGEILARLLALNLERAAGQGEVSHPIESEAEADEE